MKMTEFKAWFEGYREGMEGTTPTADQWARICARVAEIDGVAITERVYVDRYWPTSVAPYRPLYPYSGNEPVWMSNVGVGSCAINETYGYQADTLGARQFESTKAMYALGKMEAEAA